MPSCGPGTSCSSSPTPAAAESAPAVSAPASAPLSAGVSGWVGLLLQPVTPITAVINNTIKALCIFPLQFGRQRGSAFYHKLGFEASNVATLRQHPARHCAKGPQTG